MAVGTLVRRLPQLRLADAAGGGAALEWRPNALQRLLSTLPPTY
ncbi:hypothetical protein [Streptomyces sp. HUAS TT3]